MDFLKIIFFILAISLISCTSSTRLGTSVYYKLQNNEPFTLHKKSTSGFDKGIENRFFDVLTNGETIDVSFKDSTIAFFQKEREEPKPYKKMSFYCYNRQKLNNNLETIKYLKLIEINDSSIIAMATIKNKKKVMSGIRKELVEIRCSELKGVFIGRGGKSRIFVVAVPILIGLATFLNHKPQK